MSLKRRVALVEKMLQEYDDRRINQGLQSAEQAKPFNPNHLAEGNTSACDSRFSEPCSEETPSTNYS